ELSERREHRPQVCIIDEIGPLEMGSKGGHYALLRDLLENPALWCATLILTVRPALADVLSEYITAILDTSERMRVQKNTGDDHSKRKGLGVRRFNLEATSVRSIISEILARAQIQLSNLSPI
ncbi:MAG: hypothetical protein N3A02_02940, partial [Rectinema sp.]|nr:hypothetical protein [Rectinema sp.]